MFDICYSALPAAYVLVSENLQTSLVWRKNMSQHFTQEEAKQKIGRRVEVATDQLPDLRRGLTGKIIRVVKDPENAKHKAYLVVVEWDAHTKRLPSDTRSVLVSGRKDPFQKSEFNLLKELPQ